MNRLAGEHRRRTMMETPPTRIRWHEPDESQKLRALGTPGSVVAPVVPDIQLETLLRVGIPVAEGITTAREQAIELLKLVAEVEHALMVQYLYSASSVVNAAD